MKSFISSIIRSLRGTLDRLSVPFLLFEKTRKNYPILSREKVWLFAVIIGTVFLSTLVTTAVHILFHVPWTFLTFVEIALQVELVLLIPLITFFKPLPALCSVFLIELTVQKFHIGPASIRTVILLLLIAFFVYKEVILKKGWSFVDHPIIKFSFLFFLWHLFIFLVVHQSNFDPNLTLRMFIGICIPVLGLSYIKNERDLNTYITVGIISIFIVSCVPVLQKFVGEPFTKLPGIWDAPHYRYVRDITRGRFTSFSGSVLTLARNIVNVFPLIATAILLGAKSSRLRLLKKMILYPVSFIVLYATFLSGTRSAFYGIILSILPASFFVVLVSKKTFAQIAKKFLLYLLIVFSAALLFMFTRSDIKPRIEIFDDGSVKSKMPKFVSAILEAKDNLWLGIGQAFVEPLVSEDEIPVPFREISEGELGGGRAHDIFLNNLLFGGLPRLILLLVFLNLVIISAFLLLGKTARSDKNQRLYPYFYGFCIWIVSYIFYCSFHNSDPFNDLVFWHILTIMLVAISFYKKRIINKNDAAKIPDNRFDGGL